MPQFVIIAKDGRDAEVLQRRLDSRAAHLKRIDELRPQMHMGAATLNEQEQMNGSVMVVEFPSRTELNLWLQSEPYVVNKVWQEITVLPCKIGPSFLLK
jgi:uncharacterized protein YciI